MDARRREEISKTAHAVGFPRDMMEELLSDLEAAEADNGDLEERFSAKCTALKGYRERIEAVEEKLRIAREALKYYAIPDPLHSGEKAYKALEEIGQ